MLKWDEEERRSDPITLDKLENCLFKALKKFKEEENKEKIEDFRLHQAECPAFQSQKTIKWLISIPIVSTIILLIINYYVKKYGIK